MPSSLTQSVQCERPTAAQHPLVSPVLASWPNWKNQWQPFALPSPAPPSPTSSSSSSDDNNSSSGASSSSSSKKKKQDKKAKKAGNPPGQATTGPHRHQSKQDPKQAGSGGSAALPYLPALAPVKKAAAAAATAADKAVGSKDASKQAAKGDVRASKSSTTLRIHFHQKTSSYNEFTNFANYEIVYEGHVYPTSEHLFQASKFMKERPDIAEYIRTSSSRPSQAASLGRAYQAFMRPDWPQKQIAKMDEILELKFTQHPELMQLLLGTGDTELVHESSEDAFWGTGPDGNEGRNELGQALMRLRRKYQRVYSRQRQVVVVQQHNNRPRDLQKL